MNRVELIGRITADPELRYTNESNKMVTNFDVAVKRKYSTETDFIKCIAWNKTAEIINKYCKKGNQIGIEGSIETNKYEDKEGNKRTQFQVNVENITFIDSKDKNENTDTFDENTDIIPPDELPF